MELDKIAAAGWMNPAAGAALVPFVKEAVGAKAPGSPPWTTSALLKALMPNATDTQAKNLTSHLQKARKSGLLDGYFSFHPTRKLFGHPLILWNKSEAPAVEPTLESVL